jgi:uncharacterized protein (DUF3820 family)
MKLEDTSPMPFGKFKGKPMQDVPVSYLHWLWHNATNPSYAAQDVVEYIRENMDALKMENKDLIWQK